MEDANTSELVANLQTAFAALTPATMLNEGIYKNFNQCKNSHLTNSVVKVEAKQENSDNWAAAPALASVTASDFLANPNLQEEVFGPFSLLVKCKKKVCYKKLIKQNCRILKI